MCFDIVFAPAPITPTLIIFITRVVFVCAVKLAVSGQRKSGKSALTQEGLFHGRALIQPPCAQQGSLSFLLLHLYAKQIIVSRGGCNTSSIHLYLDLSLVEQL